MADRVLSQDEVDALMKGVSAGDVETENDLEEEPADADEYNLITSKERVVRGKLPTMEIINEQFCRLFRLSVFNFVRKVADVTVEGVALMKYSEYIRRIALPASFNIFQISPLRGLSLLIFEANLIFTVLNSYFGGSGKTLAKVEGREFTIFEQRVIKKIVEMVFVDMQTAWKPVFPLEFIFNRAEMSPQFVNVVVPSEIVIVSTFQIEIEGRSSLMSMCIPYSSMEPLKEKLYSSYQSDKMDVDTRWAEMFEDELRKTTLPVSSEIGETEIPIGDFLSLNIGDILMLDKKV
ncbi:MAG: flagellar motor switch protein FliM, partial [Proteobacteria bacterium]|nr:flagellar motor switch protein FliM [Pseudomonadota bacterium]